jgi:hypothetical protein
MLLAPFYRIDSLGKVYFWIEVAISPAQNSSFFVLSTCFILRYNR